MSPCGKSVPISPAPTFTVEPPDILSPLSYAFNASASPGVGGALLGVMNNDML